jgi:trigger factor
MVMGQDVCATVEEFEAKIKENLGSYYAGEAERQLEAEINAVLDKNHTFSMPDEFLKKWLQETKPETYTADNVEELYAKESVILRKQLVREKVAEEHNVEVSDEDINQASFAYTAQMLRQYGLNNPDPAMVQNFETSNRQDKNYLMRIRDVVVEKKVLNSVKDLITIKTQKINVDKFYDMVKDFSK